MVRRLKARSRREVIARRADVVRGLRDAGFDLELVNGGGTGSLEFSASDPASPRHRGSGLFSPATFDHFDGFTQSRRSCSLFRWWRPVDGIVTCAGGGYVASGPAGRDRLLRGVSAGAELFRMRGRERCRPP